MISKYANVRHFMFEVRQGLVKRNEGVQGKSIPVASSVTAGYGDAVASCTVPQLTHLSETMLILSSSCRVRQ